MKEITKLCHELQIHVLAEGVENEAQARQIRSVHCDYIQGYFYARALPLRELSSFEENYRVKVISDFEESDGAIETVSAEALVADLSEAPVEEPIETPEADLPEIPVEEPIETPEADLSEIPAEEPLETPEASKPIMAPSAPAGIPDKSLSAVPPESAVQSVEAPLPEAPAAPQQKEVQHSEAPASSDANVSGTVRPESADNKNMIHIQYGPYRLDLPGNIDIDPVSEILRAIQEKMDETH